MDIPISAVGGLARACMVGIGCLSIAWGGYSFPLFRRQADIEQVANKVIAGSGYRPETLMNYLSASDIVDTSVPCRPAAVRSAAILNLRIYEDAFASGRPETLDDRLAELRNAIHNSLECSPSDPFLWLVLFSVENARTGFRPEYLEYLRMSYRLGPHEGWIALKRSPVTLAVFDGLTPDLASHAIAEFAELVDNGLYEEAAAILAGPGRNVSDRLLSQLAEIRIERRRSFAKVLHAKVQGARVPGVDKVETPPWR